MSYEKDTTKTIKSLAADMITEQDDYLIELLEAVRNRANGGKIDLNKVVENLHDSAITSLYQHPDRDNDIEYERVD